MVKTFHSDVWFRCIICRDARNGIQKLSAYSNGDDFWLGCMYEAHHMSGRSAMNNGSSREIQIVITSHSDVWFRRRIYQDTRNWTWKLSANSNNHTFLLGFMCEAHHITGSSKIHNGSSWEIQMVWTFHSKVRFRCIICRDARNWTQKLSAYSNGHNLRLGWMYEAHDISGLSIMNSRSTQEMQMVINFHSDVRFRRIICRDGWNWTQKLSAYANGHNFWLLGIYEAHDISGRSKMNKGSSREIQIVITFHLNDRFRHIICRDARNWTRKLSTYSNSHNFWLWCIYEAHDISGCSNMKYRSSRKNQMVRTFHSGVRFRHIICRDAQNWTQKLSTYSNDHNFWIWCINEANDISGCSNMNNRSSRKIEMVRTFHSDVRFRRIICRDAWNWTLKLPTYSNGHNYWIWCIYEARDISGCSNMNNRSSRKNQMVRTFHSDVRFRRIICRDARNWTQKLSTYSNGHNFWIWCIYEAHDISRCSNMNNGSSQKIEMVRTFHSDVRFRSIICRDARNWTQKLSAYSNDHNSRLGCMYEAHDISRLSTMNKGSSREFRMVITFHSDVRFRRIICRDAQNWTQKLSAYSNGHDFWLGCMYEAHDISGRLTMNSGWSPKFKVINFHSDVWFRCIICRDAQNWPLKLSTFSNGHNLRLGWMYEAHDISRLSTMNKGSSREFQMVITFHWDVRFRRIICRDAQNWTHKLSAYSNDHDFWLGCMYEAHDISGRSTMNNGSSREIKIVITF